MYRNIPNDKTCHFWHEDETDNSYLSRMGMKVGTPTPAKNIQPVQRERKTRWDVPAQLEKKTRWNVPAQPEKKTRWNIPAQPERKTRWDVLAQ